MPLMKNATPILMTNREGRAHWMAVASEYGLGPHTFPRGWFVVAESSELDQGPRAVRFFGRDLALYRGESGNPVLLDAYCGHMGDPSGGE